ncbi:MAG: repeat containing protein [Devosia sp.]|uniref:YncE family protein n=1 Tax=Devosia sp. TaxID=1871048 RepID=UPI0026066DAA|nr:WD40 repeat domain-containing protein [Devosia sp.]MDB5539055.1 repeat containing protein [Devosia sp.]
MPTLLAAALCALVASVVGLPVSAAETLTLEATIPLPNVAGRIDHLAFDEARQHLFVAELGNNSVEVVDLTKGAVIHRIEGLSEPQGIEFVPDADILVVASGGDGSVTFFSGSDFAPQASVQLGEDADNVHLDAQSGNVVVGYGNGGLAVLDPHLHTKVGDIPLPGHPEGFQVPSQGVYVNVPNAHQIAVVDLVKGKVVAEWPQSLTANFPMAFDASTNTLATVFRDSSMLVILDAATGSSIAQIETCGDADDVFFDTKRGRLYVSCGAGAIDVFARQGGSVSLLERVPTAKGARTALFVPERDRLLVARPASANADAAIEIYRPQ